MFPIVRANRCYFGVNGDAVKQLSNRFFAEAGEPSGVSPRTYPQFGPSGYLNASLNPDEVHKKECNDHQRQKAKPD